MGMGETTATLDWQPSRYPNCLIARTEIGIYEVEYIRERWMSCFNYQDAWRKYPSLVDALESCRLHYINESPTGADR
jgi:hypothetical protein